MKTEMQKSGICNKEYKIQLFINGNNVYGSDFQTGTLCSNGPLFDNFVKKPLIEITLVTIYIPVFTADDFSADQFCQQPA